MVELANWILNYFATTDAWRAAFWLLMQNVLQFAMCVVLGDVLVVLFKNRRVIDAPLPIERQEVLWAASCVVFNSLVAIAGWWLWRIGVIKINHDIGWSTALDVVLLLVSMDFLMYVTHRICHHPRLFSLVHKTHHLYDKPRPLSLFVLSPVEVFGFGALWLFVLAVHTWSWMAIVIYLLLNATFGTLGHLGVEPFPWRWPSWPLIGRLTTSTFHGQHHKYENANFGFYTDIWDRLFGTLHSTYGPSTCPLEKQA